MATNNILQFANTASGGNILTQSQYAADSQRQIGHQPGIARQELENKALLQASTIAAAVAQYIADRQTTDVSDSLTPAQIAGLLSSASGAKFATLSATGTFTVPAGVYLLDVEVWGAGGGGGGVGSTNNGSSSGGGGGGYSRGTLAVTPGQNISAIVGAAGAAGTAGNSGGTGGTSTFNVFNATGGAGGTANGVGSGGAGGVGSGGVINAVGGSGSGGLVTGQSGPGGTGGGAAYGGPGGGGALGLGGSGVAPGGGGGGTGSATVQTGAVGARGQINIRY